MPRIIYTAVMLLVMTAGVACIWLAGTHLILATGLALATIGAGGISAGVMSRIDR